MKKVVSLVLCLAVLLAVMVLPAFAEEERCGGTLVVRINGDPVSFNPSISSDDNLYKPAQNFYNRLVKLDASKQIIPDAAESWDVSEDGMTITFHLRQDMYWTDGEALDAEDVAYTFTYIKEHSTCYFSSKMSNVASVEAVDPYTVVFNMAEPDVSIIARLGWYGTFILPEHVFNNGQEWADNPASTTPTVTSGPFTFVEYKQGESITLAANPNYFGGSPQVDTVVFSIIADSETAVQALLNGEIDELASMPTSYVEQLMADDSVVLALNEYPSPIRIVFNCLDEKISDQALRTAISMCIDREDISAKATAGIMPPEYAMYPSLIAWASNTEDVAPAFSVENAEKTLIDAGYTKDADGYYVRGLTIDVFSSSAYYADAAKLIAANCAKAGIELSVNVLEYNSWSQKVGTERNFQLEMQGGFMGPDPSAMRDRIGTGQGSNYSGYSNAEVDELLQKAVATGVTEERAGYFKAVQKILAEELPYVNILAYAGYDAHGANVENLPIDGTGKWGWNEYTYTRFVD